jgi:HEAT repeat protein
MARDNPDSGQFAAAKVNEPPFQLLHALKWGALREQINAARTLGGMRDQYSVPALIGALSHRNQIVRGWAAWALGEIGDRSAVRPLLESFDRYAKLFPTDHLQEETRCIPAITCALSKLTGVDFAFDLQKWKDYINSH